MIVKLVEPPTFLDSIMDRTRAELARRLDECALVVQLRNETMPGGLSGPLRLEMFNRIEDIRRAQKLARRLGIALPAECALPEVQR